MEIKFSDPYLISVAVMLLLAVVFILFFFRARVRKLSLFSLIVRAFAGLVVALALGQPYLESSKESSQAILLVDISDSNETTVSEELFKKAKTYLEGGVELVVVPFSKLSAGAQYNSIYLNSYSKLKEDFSGLDIGETNLEKAFDSIKDGGPSSVILLSDGFETEGKISRSLSSLSSLGFKIFPLLPDNAEQRVESFKISYIHAPLMAPSEKSVEIRVALKSTTNKSEGGVLQIFHDDKEIFSKQVQVEPGQEALYIAQSDPSKEGIREIRAEFKPLNKNFNRSSASVYVSSKAREKVLLVSGTTEDQRFLKPLLENQAYQLKTLVGRSEKWPELSDFSVIILNNIAASELPSGMAVKVKNYVEGGGSFIMVGGNRSFGLGGYINTPIEELLPVSLLPPQSVQKRLSVAVQLVIDKSKSMKAGGRIEFAKEAAIGVVDNLKDDDFVGVMGFDENPFVVIRLSQVASVRDLAVERIGRLFPNFGTSLVGAMDEARRDLTRIKAGRKHMIILTDGQITDAPAHYYYQLVKEIRYLGITVSTVLLGGESDGGMLRELANLGGGAFYKTNDPRALPKIFIDDVKVASGERTLKEESDYQVSLGQGELKSTEIQSFPNLRGYVQTKIKSKANLELIVRGSEASDPLLASWRYGKGKSLAFTSDTNGRWSNDWVPWSRFQEFWNGLIESLRVDVDLKKDQDIPFDLVYYYESGKLHFDLSLFSSANSGNVRSQVILPGGEKRIINFEQSAAGRYKAELSEPIAGKYEVQTSLGATQLTPIAFNLSGELFGEKKNQGFNTALLKNLASETGGKVNPAIDDLKRQKYITISKQDLTSWFLISALILLCFEILWREVFSLKFGMRRILRLATLNR